MDSQGKSVLDQAASVMVNKGHGFRGRSFTARSRRLQVGIMWAVAGLRGAKFCNPDLCLYPGPDLCLYSSSWSELDKQQNFGQGSKNPRVGEHGEEWLGDQEGFQTKTKWVSLEAYIKHVKKHHDFDLTNSFEKHILNICKRTIVMSQTQPIQ